MANVGNWIGEITTTVGTGDISLGGAIPGYTTFSSQPSSEFWYVILDGRNREAGICSISGITLTRATIYSTLENGSYNGIDPNPIDLSGKAEVYCTFNKTAFDEFAKAKEDIDNANLVFAPIVHTHIESDITDLDKYTKVETDSEIISAISDHESAADPHPNYLLPTDPVSDHAFTHEVGGSDLLDHNNLTNAQGFKSHSQIDNDIGALEGDVLALQADTHTHANKAILDATTASFTTADETKLDGIATNANNYTHPSFNGDDINVDTGALSGATVISDLDFNITTNTQGHVTDANATVATRNLTLANLGFTGDTNANDYTHPTNSVSNPTLTGASVFNTFTTNSEGHVTGMTTRTMTPANIGAATSSQGSNADTAFSWGDHSLAGYAISSGQNTANWDTAYGWGNHALAGYALGSDVVPNTGGTFTGEVAIESTLPAIFFKETDIVDNNAYLFVNNGSFAIQRRNDNNIFEASAFICNLAGATTLYYNGDSKFATSSTGVSVTGTVAVTGGNSTNWNTAYGWGNHALAGYALGSDVVPNTGGTFTGNVNFDSVIYVGGRTLIDSASGIVRLRSVENSATVALQGPDSGGTNRNLFRGDPGGSGVLYFAGGQKLATVATGITVTGEVTTTDGNSNNWNTAYGWGDHASAGYAPLASPALTGNPTAPTQSLGDDSTKIATTAFVKNNSQSSGGLESGTRLAFPMSSAPTGWTQVSGFANKALRLVDGAGAGTGGSVNFTTAFASKSVNGSIANKTATGTITINNHTLSKTQMPSHSHTLGRASQIGTFTNTPYPGHTQSGTFSTASQGSSGSHNHGGSFSGTAHNHTFTGTAINLAVKYVDFLIAEKD